MNRQWNLAIRPEPYWLMEMMVCMNYVYVLDSEEWLEKSNGWSRRQKEEFLLPYRSYRGAMRARLKPVLEQYPLLGGYVDSTPRERESLRSYDPPMIAFLTQMQYVLEGEERPSEEKLEGLLNRAFQRMLGSDLQKSLDAQEPVIRCLGDVMEALEGWEGADADKFKLLRLYSERREVMEQLWSIQGACAEVGRSCLELVRERYDACMELLKKPEELASLLHEVGLQCGENCVGCITPAVMRYDGIMLQATEDMEDTENPAEPAAVELKLYLGIETFYLCKSRQEDLYNDDRLLARLKALGDPVRLKIIHQLVERPCYLQEMARELGLTPATVLHHLGILMEEDLIEVQMTQEKKKVYYRVRKQGLEEAGRGIDQLSLTYQERRERQREQQVQEGQQRNGGWQWKIQK